MADAKLTIPIDIQKGWGRQGQYTASVGPIAGRGRSMAEAKDDLLANLLAALSAGSVDPAFARDDDGSLIVAVQGLVGGVTHWRVGDDNPRPITGCDGPPRKSLETTPHYTALGRPA